MSRCSWILWAGCACPSTSLTLQHAVENVLPLAVRHAISSYDAAYLELALRKRAPLATLDAGLARAARDAGVALIGEA